MDDPATPRLNLNPPAGDEPSAPPNESSLPEKPTGPKSSRKANARTAVRAPKALAGRTGARSPRKARPVAEERPVERVHLVMTTSKISDQLGRAVARRRVALVSEARAEHLVPRGLARVATADEIEAAAGAVLPIID